MNLTAPKQNAPHGYEHGLKAAAEVTTPPCPFADDSAEHKAWLDGLLDGMTNLAWNVRSCIQAGMTARWMSEAVSMQLGISLGKAIIPFGAEMLIYFRIGFVLCDQNVQLPVMDIDGWRKFANVINRTLKGELMDVAAESPTNLECFAWDVTKSFVLNILDGQHAPADPKQRIAKFECELPKLLAWMGAPSDTINLKL